MPKICYTRNFEDVILQRVFADLSLGTFIDVGASMPVIDSNTYALYQKGWRGIALEPLDYRQEWHEIRPEDIFLNVAAASQAGHLELQIYDQAMQISTGSAATHAHWEHHGVQSSRKVSVPVMTLNQVIGSHLAAKPLHLLSIDVEGMEFEVLKGLDMTVHRPWVLVLEATVPGTPIPCHQSWEPYVLDAGYLLAYFDGANRFYLANEQRHLLGHFALPPNVWDDFVLFRELQLRAQVEELQQHISRLSG